MTGISTGAFYLFYASKEMLFVDTAQSVSGRFLAILEQDIPENPTKYDFANAIKRMAKALEGAEWFLSLSGEFEVILRKLPPDYLEQVQVKDVSDFSGIIKKYRLTPTVADGEVAITLRALLMMLHNKKLIGEGFMTAFAYILDSTIETLFR
jgi:AcrR family transcriptional regulator